MINLQKGGFLFFRISLIVVVCVVSVWLLIGLGEASTIRRTDNRAADPVVVAGAVLTDFIGVPITDVVLLAYDGSSWQPVPFQIDEKMIEADDTEPDFVAFEDGLIDADDELVWMAQDAGVTTATWPDDSTARQHARAAISLIDPLAAVSGSVYLFRSTTLPRSTAQYVSLNFAGEEVTTLSYTLGFNNTSFLGIDRLMLNGESADLIDRQKLRVTVNTPFGPITQNEDALAGEFAPFVSAVAGPVRIVEGGDFGYAFYQDHVEVTFRLDIDALNDQIALGSVGAIRTSMDHNPAAQTQLVNYFDSNGANETIDGVADPLVSSNLRDWYQASGGPTGGYVAVFKQLALDGGTLSTYYADQQTPSGDTGDMQQFSDTGISAQSPSGILAVQQLIYVLPPNTSTNLGPSYAQRAAQPLSATVAFETYSLTSAIELTTHTTTNPQLLIHNLLLILWGALFLATGLLNVVPAFKRIASNGR